MDIIEAQRAIESKLWEILSNDLGGREQASVLGLAVHASPPRPGAFECTVFLGYNYDTTRIVDVDVEDMSNLAVSDLVVRRARESLARFREMPAAPPAPEFDVSGRAP